jgi:hypothetical protein
MPRNSSGVYQLPAGNPVVSGTLVESVWANSTMSDMAQALTDSLDRFGRSTMAAPLLLNDGTVASPGLAFGAESSTGLFRKSSKVLGVAAGGTEVATFTQAGIVVAGTIAAGGNITTSGSITAGSIATSAAFTLVDGTPALPGLAFTADTNLGLYRPAADVLGIAANGANVASFDVDGIAMPGGGRIKGIAGRLLFNKTTDDGVTPHQFTGALRINGTTAGTLGVRRGGASGATINAGYDAFVIESDTAVGMTLATTAAASSIIAFAAPAGPSQGWMRYDHAAALMDWGVAAGQRLRLSASQLISAVSIIGPDGSAGAPGYGFSGEATTGLYRYAAGAIGFAGAGAVMATLGAGGLYVGSASAQLAAGGRGLMEANGATSCALGLDVAGANVANLYATPTLVDLTSVPALRFITNGNERARFTAAPGGQNELLIGTTTAINSSSGRGILAINGNSGAYLGLDSATVNRAYLYATSAQFQIRATAVPIQIGVGGDSIVIDVNNVAAYAGNEIGYRDLPQGIKSAPYTLTAADRGTCVRADGACSSVTVPQLATNSVVSICNNTTAITVVASGVTFRWGTGVINNGTTRTLAVNGLMTLFWLAPTVVLLTGTGIS